MIRGVIFDLGNTLMYFSGDWDQVMSEAYHALTRVLLARGYDLDEDQFPIEVKKHIHEYYVQRDVQLVELTTFSVLREMLEYHGYPEIPDRILRDALNAMYTVTQGHWIPEEDAIQTLDVLKNSGYRLGVISNAGDENDVQVLIDKLGARAYFDFILVSAEVGLRKPHPRIFHMALDQWGFLPGETLMVGDTLDADILGANHVGLKGVWIVRRTDSQASENIYADYTINHLSELPALISLINTGTAA